MFLTFDFKYIFKSILILHTIFDIYRYGYGYSVSPYESAIGRWKLLYSDNFKLNNNYIDLSVEPDSEQLRIKIKKYENKNLVTIKKMILCSVDDSIYENIHNKTPDLNPFNNGERCTLVLIKSQKFIKSIGIFEFPYFALNYRTGLCPKCIICWKYNPIFGRLYIYIDNHTYVFQKNYYDKFSDKQENISMNIFIIANIVSFLFGKLLEKAIHID